MKAQFLNVTFTDRRTQANGISAKKQQNRTGETQAACKTDDNGANPY